MGIAHVKHTPLQTDTHHATALTDSLKGCRQFNLRDMIILDLLLHDVLMELCKDLGSEDILSEDAVKFFRTFFIAHTQEFLRIAGLGLLLHHRDVQDGMIFVFPDTGENAIMTHL